MQTFQDEPMAQVSSRDLSARMAQRVTEVLAGIVRPGQAYGVVDFPSYPNIGDSAIWGGQKVILRQVHCAAPAYVAHNRYSPNEPSRLMPEGGILYIQGGGNFGDIWLHHQRYREAVIARNPRLRIVQLPQSLHYKSPKGVEATQRVIAAHPDFHLMVRDHQSFEFARTHFDCAVYLAPDSAFGMDMTRFSRCKKPDGILCLLRNDSERRPDAADGRNLFSECRIEDWRRQPDLRRLAEKALLGAFMTLPLQATQPLRARAFDAMVINRLELGFAQLDEAQVVVTDRLHGHIMATLLGKPHVVIDNFYGKIANFIAAFGKDAVTLQARDYAEAREMANALMEKRVCS